MWDNVKGVSSLIIFVSLYSESCIHAVVDHCAPHAVVPTDWDPASQPEREREIDDALPLIVPNSTLIVTSVYQGPSESRPRAGRPELPSFRPCFPGTRRFDRSANFRFLELAGKCHISSVWNCKCSVKIHFQRTLENIDWSSYTNTNYSYNQTCFKTDEKYMCNFLACEINDIYVSQNLIKFRSFLKNYEIMSFNN